MVVRLPRGATGMFRAIDDLPAKNPGLYLPAYWAVTLAAAAASSSPPLRRLGGRLHRLRACSDGSRLLGSSSGEGEAFSLHACEGLPTRCGGGGGDEIVDPRRNRDAGEAGGVAAADQEPWRCVFREAGEEDRREPPAVPRGLARSDREIQSSSVRGEGH